MDPKVDLELSLAGSVGLRAWAPVITVPTVDDATGGGRIYKNELVGTGPKWDKHRATFFPVTQHVI